ncbi:Sorting nexin, cytoplasm-to-vacuole targeting pathway/endosomal sorting, partial [Ascosphaera acerosa]
MELGARLNAFSLSEASRSLASAIETTGQALDRSYILTSELHASLSAAFAEPMRELAQFAAVVRAVVRYRVLKRVQQEMTLDELNKKRAVLDALERSEMEASRINRYLSGADSRTSTNVLPDRTAPHGLHRPASADAPQYAPGAATHRHTSTPSANVAGTDQPPEETSSIDSDFPSHHHPHDSPAAPSPSWPPSPSDPTSSSSTRTGAPAYDG